MIVRLHKKAFVNIQTKHELYRVDGFTTNGYFMIRSDLEHRILKQFPTSTEKPPVASVLKKFSYSSPMTLVFSWYNQEQQFVYLKNKSGQEICLNAYFYQLFIQQVKHCVFVHDTYNRYSPVVVYDANTNNVVGVIMPIKT